MEAAGAVDQTQAWMETLVGVYAYEIFDMDIFNADPHPGPVMHDIRTPGN